MSQEFQALLRLETEERISLKQARALFHTRPSIKTLQRFIAIGVGQPLGAGRVYLEGYREGRSYITSKQAVKRFLARINGKDTE